MMRNVCICVDNEMMRNLNAVMDFYTMYFYES